VAQAERGNCGLVATGVRDGARCAFRYEGGGAFRDDRAGAAPCSLEELLGSAGPGRELTFTGVPPGR
jgi:hypothetical protein